MNTQHKRSAPLAATLKVTALLLTLSTSPHAHAGFTDWIQSVFSRPGNAQLQNGAPGLPAGYDMPAPHAPFDNRAFYVRRDNPKHTLQDMLTVNDFTVDLVDAAARGEFGYIAPRPAIDMRLQQALVFTNPRTMLQSTPPNSLVVVGPIQSGRTYLIRRQALMIADHNRANQNDPAAQIPITIKALDIQGLLHHTYPAAETPKIRMDKIIDEIANHNMQVRTTGQGSYIILFIEKMGQVLGGQSGSQAVEGDLQQVGNAIKRAMADGRLTVWGDATVAEMHGLRSSSAGLAQTLTEISAPVPRGEEMHHIVRLATEQLTSMTGIHISADAIKEALRISASRRGGHAEFNDTVQFLRAAAQLVAAENTAEGPLQLRDAEARLEQLTAYLRELHRESRFNSSATLAAEIDNIQLQSEELSIRISALRGTLRAFRTGNARGHVEALSRNLEQLNAKLVQAERRANGNAEALREQIDMLDQTIAASEAAIEDMGKWLNAHYVNGTAIVGPQTVRAAIAQASNESAEFLAESQAVRIARIGERVLKQVHGQDAAVETILQGVNRKLTGNSNRTRPYSALLFGPSGVGKTEFAKALAAALFGEAALSGEGPYITLQMNMYPERHQVASIFVGAPAGYVGYGDMNSTNERVRRYGGNVVLLMDEIEKADTSIWKNIMQILDEGTVTDSKGEVFDYKNAIILFTSNLGLKEKRSIAIQQARLAELDTQLASARQGLADYEAIVQDLKNSPTSPDVTAAITEAETDVIPKAKAHVQELVRERVRTITFWTENANEFDELLNKNIPIEGQARLNDVVEFDHLSPQVSAAILHKMIEKNIMPAVNDFGIQSLEFTPAAIAAIAAIGTNSDTGARGLIAALDRTVSNMLADTVTRLRAIEALLPQEVGSENPEGHLIKGSVFKIDFVPSPRAAGDEQVQFHPNDEIVLHAVSCPLMGVPQNSLPAHLQNHSFKNRTRLGDAVPRPMQAPRPPQLTSGERSIQEELLRGSRQQTQQQTNQE